MRQMEGMGKKLRQMEGMEQMEGMGKKLKWFRKILSVTWCALQAIALELANFCLECKFESFLLSFTKCSMDAKPE